MKKLGLHNPQNDQNKQKVLCPFFCTQNILIKHEKRGNVMDLAHQINDQLNERVLCWKFVEKLIANNDLKAFNSWYISPI